MEGAALALVTDPRCLEGAAHPGAAEVTKPTDSEKDWQVKESRNAKNRNKRELSSPLGPSSKTQRVNNGAAIQQESGQSIKRFLVNNNGGVSAYQNVRKLEQKIGNVFGARLCANGQFLVTPRDKTAEKLIVDNLNSSITVAQIETIRKGKVVRFPLGVDIETLRKIDGIRSATRLNLAGKKDIPTMSVVIEYVGDVKEFVDCGIFGRFKVFPFIPEPPRCYNCQKLGHVAKQCCSYKRCGICTKQHDSNECVEKIKRKESVDYKCINCHEKHPAWAKTCPARLNLLFGKQQQQEQQRQQQQTHTQQQQPLPQRNYWVQRQQQQQQQRQQQQQQQQQQRRQEQQKKLTDQQQHINDRVVHAEVDNFSPDLNTEFPPLPMASQPPTGARVPEAEQQKQQINNVNNIIPEISVNKNTACHTNPVKQTTPPQPVDDKNLEFEEMKKEMKRLRESVDMLTMQLNNILTNYTLTPKTAPAQVISVNRQSETAAQVANIDMIQELSPIKLTSPPLLSPITSTPRQENIEESDLISDNDNKNDSYYNTISINATQREITATEYSDSDTSS